MGRYRHGQGGDDRDRHGNHFEMSVTYKHHIILFISILILTVNMLELILLLKHRRRWKNAQILLFSLSLADFLLGFTYMFYSLFKLLDIGRRNRLFLNVSSSFLYVNLYGSSMQVMLLTLDRLVAVKRPLKYRAWITQRRITKSILLSWLVSVTVGILMQVLKKLHKNAYTWSILGTVVCITEVVFFVVAYVSILVQYRKISRKATINFSTSIGTVRSNKTRKFSDQPENSEGSARQSSLGYQSADACSCFTSFDNISVYPTIFTENFCSCSKTKRNGFTPFHIDYERERSHAREELPSDVISKADEAKIRKVSAQSNENSRLSQKDIAKIISNRERRLLILCIVTVLCFTLSFLSFGIGVMFHHVVEHNKGLKSFIQILSICGSLWNPFIYFFYHHYEERRRRQRKKAKAKKISFTNHVYLESEECGH